MKYVFLAILWHANMSFAADRVGNGGGLWTCGDGQAFLVDLYEAKEEFGLNIINSNLANPIDIVNERQGLLQKTWPQMNSIWSKHLSDVLSKIRFVDSELVVIEDSLYRLRPHPNSCRFGAWKYVQFANYTEQDQVLVRKDFWAAKEISSVDKAALIWHEVIYRWFRVQHGDKDSVRARQVVGLLFSTLPAYLMVQEMEKVIHQVKPKPEPKPEPQPQSTETWVCATENKLTHFVFAGYGMSQKEAESNSKQSCQAAGKEFHCSDSPTCQEFTAQEEKHFCEAKNNLSSKVFGGKGRNVLEAQTRALRACQDAGQEFHCMINVCN